VVYVASADGNLYALDAYSGTLLWKYAGGFYTSSPAVANGVVYIGGSDQVYGFDATKGTLLWSYTTDTSFQYASPTVANGAVITGSDAGTVFAFAPTRNP
jgi:outer membrane protein assembly factor BamB